MAWKSMRIAAWSLLATAVVGCGGRYDPPTPADPAAARDALRTALDAWQKGDAADSLKTHRPPLYVTDHEWRSGWRLLSYQLQSDDPAGGDLRCRVVLSLADATGRSLSKTAFYAVGTSPALTVAREEDP